jgi:hypothetical protein
MERARHHLYELEEGLGELADDQLHPVEVRRHYDEKTAGDDLLRRRASKDPG